jgi:hypothetical protein
VAMCENQCRCKTRRSQFVKLLDEREQFATLIRFVENRKLCSDTMTSPSDDAGGNAVTNKLNDLVQKQSWSQVLSEILSLPALQKRLFTEVGEEGSDPICRSSRI